MKMNKLKEYFLKDLYEISSGISTKPEQAGSGYPFISFRTIFNNWILPNELNDLMNTSEIEREKYSIKKGDILLTRTSEKIDELAMSSVALKDYENTTFSGFAKRLRPTQTDITYDKFMAFFLRSPYFREIIDKKTTMTLRASFNETLFSQIKILLPEYKTQVKIGELLCKMEEKIKLNNKINSELENMAKTIYNYWFLQFEFPNEEGKPYKLSGGKMVWNEELKKEIPKGWEVKKIGSLFKSQNGYAFKSSNWKEKGHPVLTIKNILPSGDIDMKTSSYIERYTENLKKYAVSNGNIIFAMSGNTIGKIGIVASKIKNILINQRILIIKTQLTDIAYLYFTLINKNVQNKIYKLGSNSAQPNISEDELKNIKICIPTSDILKQYNSECKKIFEKIIQNRIESQELISLRDYLLPLLMNGQVGFKD